MYAVIAIQISNALNIRKCRQELALPILFSDSDELFKHIMDHRESSKLEWIIILLILVEVVDVFVIRILNLF